MTDEAIKTAALAAIKARMLTGEPFTYTALCVTSKMHGGTEGKDRYADRTIQRWRKKGWIAFSREGRAVVWKLTDKGVAEAADDLQ